LSPGAAFGLGAPFGPGAAFGGRHGDGVDGREGSGQALDQGHRVAQVGRPAGEAAEQQGGHVADGGVGVGGDQRRRGHRGGGEQLQDGRLAGGVEIGILVVPARARPAAQHQLVGRAGRVGYVDGMVGQPGRRQRPHRDHPAAGPERRRRPAQGGRGRAAEEQPGDPRGFGRLDRGHAASIMHPAEPKEPPWTGSPPCRPCRRP
jgi:hypothetical protein